MWQASAKKVKQSRKPIVWNYFKEENDKSGVKNIVSDVKQFIKVC